MLRAKLIEKLYSAATARLLAGIVFSSRRPVVSAFVIGIKKISAYFTLTGEFAVNDEPASNRKISAPILPVFERFRPALSSLLKQTQVAILISGSL
jgi:hypothetical protein